MAELRRIPVPGDEFGDFCDNPRCRQSMVTMTLVNLKLRTSDRVLEAHWQCGSCDQVSIVQASGDADR